MNAKLVVNQECHGLELYFPEKPDEEVLTQLKSARWRYHRVKKCWYARQNATNQEIAEQIAGGSIKADVTTPAAEPFFPAYDRVNDIPICKSSDLSCWETHYGYFQDIQAYMEVRLQQIRIVDLHNALTPGRECEQLVLQPHDPYHEEESKTLLRRQFFYDNETLRYDVLSIIEHPIQDDDLLEIEGCAELQNDPRVIHTADHLVVSGKALTEMLHEEKTDQMIGSVTIRRQTWEQLRESLDDWRCLIDTENESGSLYVGKQIAGVIVGEYLTINLEAPYSAARYLEAIDLAEQAGVEYLVIDSLSHAWTGEGGLLDVQGNVAKRSGNSYTAWREVTPLHNKLVDRILQCPMHVAVTLRTKTEYVIEDSGNGKKTPRKIGMAPVFRDGVEYEFTIFFELDQSHAAAATKDRTGLFDGQYFLIAPDTGASITKKGFSISPPLMALATARFYP